MTKVVVATGNAPKSLAGYSQAVKAGGFVFVSGQGPFDPVTGEVHGETTDSPEWDENFYCGDRRGLILTHHG